MHTQEEIFELIDTYLGISEVERKTFGEVSTPIYDNPGSVDEQLKLLDDDFWKNPYTKVLDPASGLGNYEVVLLANFMNGLKDYVDDKIDLRDSVIRYKWIMEEIIYVVDINSKNLWLYYNIFDPDNELKLNYYLGSFIKDEDDKQNKTHKFINHMKNEWGIDKFDLITTNPPYQEMDGGFGASSTPIYNLFVEDSINISDKIIMITPSRWFASGIGLNVFRKNMLKRTDIKNIIHFDKCDLIFNDVNISGGISYFFIDKSYNGTTSFQTNDDIYDINISSYDILVRDPKSYDILTKVLKNDNFSNIISSQSPYGIRTNYNKYLFEKSNDLYKIYARKSYGEHTYIEKRKITKNLDTIEKHKVITSAVAMPYPGKIFLAEPYEICSETFITIICKNKIMSENIKSYMETKFFTYLVRLRQITQHVSKKIFKWVPIIDFNKAWTDKELYNYFNLTQNEIDLIEKTKL